jgi:hypothetical protein
VLPLNTKDFPDTVYLPGFIQRNPYGGMMVKIVGFCIAIRIRLKSDIVKKKLPALLMIV